MEQTARRYVTTSKYPQGTGFDTEEELNASYETILLPEAEYEYLNRSGINDRFSEICDDDFSDCEGGEIPCNLLEECYNLVKPHSKELPTLCATFEKAIHYGTYLDFDY
ncbi:MAG: hypothetical protein MR291_08530 [Oscillospiraceae bacterium]|nr:hypothetical protein [Oscillospiraceae bacterium]